MCQVKKCFLFSLIVEERVAEKGFSHLSLGYVVVKTVVTCCCLFKKFFEVYRASLFITVIF